MAEDPPSNILSLEEVARLLDSPPSFVAQLVARDAIPYQRPKKGLRKYRTDELRFKRDEIEEWLKSS
ncbi:MAG TPA: helix-turn-helix domain-containing protein [Solirubrobacterales bacterium]|nr:helix-turn-helix domain-containing protein [Solirubrobacterales bacterium]